MNDPPSTFQVPRRSLLPLLWHPWTRYAAAWIVALVMCGVAAYYAWFDFYRPDRPDRTDGHRAIDFGGQYLMGRMVQQGFGKELYSRERQRKVLEAAYLREYQAEDVKPDDTDTEHLMSFTMGSDSSKGERGEWEARLLELVGEDAAIPINPPHTGGPLYPPINALVSYPYGWMPPHIAYRVSQGMNLLLAVLAALAVNRITSGRVWWPVALCFLLIYPGFAGSFCLGQNAALTLNILLWGWLLITCDRPIAAGVVWGLLAFKPVWLLSFLLVPLLTRRWRVALTMLATAAVMTVATLPIVGVHGWFDWLRIGHEAAVWYETDENWIFMSRDLYSIPRRWLLDFKLPMEERIVYPHWTRILSISLPATALIATVTVVCIRNKRVAAAKDGPAAAFLLLGAWMSCFHFMYYDVLLTVLPFCLLFTHPRRLLEPLFLGLKPFGRCAPDESLLRYFSPRTYFQRGMWLPFVIGGYGQMFLINSIVLSLFVFLLSIQYLFPYLGIGIYKGPPSDTFVLIGLWLWCGYRVIADKDESTAPVSIQIEDRTNEAIRTAGDASAWNGTLASPAESAELGIRAKPL
jgi:hypothetical protein